MTRNPDGSVILTRQEALEYIKLTHLVSAIRLISEETGNLEQTRETIWSAMCPSPNLPGEQNINQVPDKVM